MSRHEFRSMQKAFMMTNNRRDEIRQKIEDKINDMDKNIAIKELEELISKHTRLDECGSIMKGDCPFCEVPACFTFTKGTFYCYTCHKGGTNTLEFMEALNGAL